MFHGLGLTERYRTSNLRFEVDGANAELLEAEIALVTAGVETDVLGIGRDDLALREACRRYRGNPRPDFKRRILQAFTDGNKHRPRTTFGDLTSSPY